MQVILGFYGLCLKTGINMIKREWVGLAVFKAFRQLLLAVRIFWLRLAVLAFVLGAFLLDHSVFYGRKRHNRETNTSKHNHKNKMSSEGGENRRNG